TVTAAESGASGTITLSATASDNVGVTNVEFYVDGVLKGADASTPYSLALDSTTLSNASHSLVAKAYDAAGNIGTSTAVGFTVSNTVSTQFNEVESNGSVAAANVVAHSFKTIVGTMGNTTDKDFFALSLAAGETVKIDMTGPSTTDYDLFVVNGSDAMLVSSTSSSSTETLSYTNGGAAQTVYAKVIAYSGSSTTVPYTLTLTYTAGTVELIGNGGFESGNTVWTASSGVIDNGTTQAARTGSWKAWLDGYGSAHTDTLLQTVSIPAAASTATLNFWLKVVSSETSTTSALDTLKLQVRNSSGAVLATLKTYSNLDKGSSYVQRSFDLSAYKGQTIQVYFIGVENASVTTSFLIDDVSLK
ncbi:MAG: Ig-like domain-containing protein, partial [Arenimonas sp.]